MYMSHPPRATMIALLLFGGVSGVSLYGPCESKHSVSLFCSPTLRSIWPFCPTIRGLNDWNLHVNQLLPDMLPAYTLTAHSSDSCTGTKRTAGLKTESLQNMHSDNTCTFWQLEAPQGQTKTNIPERLWSLCWLGASSCQNAQIVSLV